LIIIYVAVRPTPTTVTTFEQTLRQVVDEARNTAGCLRYEWYRDPDAPLRYTIYGEFDTGENFANYLASAVVQRIGAELLPLLDAPPAFKHFEATMF
jgi:quinol monooxygenase YgiN